MTMRFHWSMSSAGEKYRGAQARAAVGVPALDTLVRFCRHAEECEIDSLLTAFGFHRPDPIVLAGVLGALTTKIKFMVAVRSGIFSPTVFVQQVNSVATMTNGRICLNVVAGHTPEEQRYYGDFLSHDERYDRTDEFLAVCDAFWRREAEVDFDGKYYRIEKGKLNVPFVAPDRTRPEIFLGGNSVRAEEMAVKYADCLWRLPDKPDALRQRTPELLEKGIEVGLLVSLIVRPTRREALAATEKLLEEVGGRPRRTHEEFAKRSDSVAFTSTYELAAKNDAWITDYLWSGAVPFLGAPAMAIVGSPEEVADALFEFRAAGITQFLFMGWPDMEEMTNFHSEVLPLVRAREAAEQYGNYIAQD
ncbi:MAG TPA: LLM class flavin-dependent oxidoreductase [Thermoanaerobaculia bacterium]|jgi:alkanesulfonate monooxygenase|nr:LLM class flavin-dependent oxidoreductase [Thermoanaerobaculia bacterium]